MQLSPHFTLEEFEQSQTATRLGIDNSAPKHVIANLQLLAANILEPIREHFGPVVITSGYRCPELNTRIGGSANSQHCKGQAADIVIANYSAIEVCKKIVELALPFDQLIHEGTWTHISYSDQLRGQVLTAHFGSGKATYTAGLA